jgi:O-antigen/teichoic acid export membrane protein
VVSPESEAQLPLVHDAPGTFARTESLTLSALWLLAAKVVAFVINVALPMLIVRRLNQTEFGLYKQTFLAVTSAALLLPFGFGMTAFYFFPRERARRGAVMFNVLLFCGGMGVLGGGVLLAFPGLLVSLFGEPVMARYAPLIGLLIPLWIVSLLLETFPVVNQEFKVATRLIVLSQLSRTGLLCLAAILYGTVVSLLYAAIFHAAIQVVVVFWYLESRLPGFWRHVDLSLLRSQIIYAIPLGYSGLIWTFQNDLHNYFVSHQFGAAVFAVYSVGCLQVPLMGILNEAASSVMIGRVAELEMQDDKQEILALTARVTRKLAAIVFAVYAFLLVMGREFISLLFTKRYLDSWPIFAVNISLLLLIPVIADPILRCYPKHLPFIVKTRSVLFVLMVLALWLFTGRFGPIAAITIAVLTNYADRALTAFHFAPVIGFTWSRIGVFRDTGKLAVAAAVSGVATALLRPALLGRTPFVSLLICGIFFVLIYGITVVLLRIPNEDEWHLVRRYIPVLRPLFWRT